MSKVILGEHKPKEWLVCPQCSNKTVIAITAQSWQCFKCGTDYRLYRSGKVWKMQEAREYWARFR